MDDVPLPLGLPELTSSEDEYPVHPAAEAFRTRETCRGAYARP